MGPEAVPSWQTATEWQSEPVWAAAPAVFSTWLSQSQPASTAQQSFSTASGRSPHDVQRLATFLTGNRGLMANEVTFLLRRLDHEGRRKLKYDTVLWLLSSVRRLKCSIHLPGSRDLSCPHASLVLSVLRIVFSLPNTSHFWTFYKVEQARHPLTIIHRQLCPI